MFAQDFLLLMHSRFSLISIGIPGAWWYLYFQPKRQLLMINGKIIKVKFSSIFMLFLGLFIYTALQNQRKIYLFSKVLIARRQSTQVLLGIQFIRLQRLLVLLLWQEILSLGINKKWVKRQAMTPDCKQEENVLQTFVFYSSNYILYFLFNVAVFS